MVTKAKGSNTPNSSLRTSKYENVMLFYLGGNKISVKEIPKGTSSGFKETKIVIKSDYKDRKHVSIEDFVCFDRDKVAVVNNYGVLQIFRFSLSREEYRKISEIKIHDVNSKYRDFPIGLTFKKTKDSFLFALSTIYDDNEGSLRDEEIGKSLKIIEFKDKELQIIAENKVEFDQNKPSSGYYYLDWSFSYKGKDILLAMQNDDQRNCDVFTFEDGNLELVHREAGYSEDYFTAVGKVDGIGIVNVDYGGVMKIVRFD